MRKNVAENRYRLYQRANGVFYAECVVSRKQQSLGTKDEGIARNLLAEMNEAKSAGQIQRARAVAVLKVCDPRMTTRTWSDVQREYCTVGKPQTQARKIREFKHSRFNRLRDKALIDTTAEDFFAVMEQGGAAVNHYLKCLHNLANGMNWLFHPIIPPKLWRKIEPKLRRAITREEHDIILRMEKNTERNLYYQLVWETGASQSDCALLRAENIDWKARVVTYARCKTAEVARLGIGSRMEAILRQLPSTGYLFPTIAPTSANDRAAEFSRRKTLAGLSGVSLHSYRYAWAERAKRVGFSERQAQAALGQESVAVHRSYAKGACLVCPSLDDAEAKQAG
jgi:integrase